MLRKLSMAVTAAMVFALGGVPSPAQAAPGDCGIQRLCIWTGTNFTGGRYEFSKATIYNGGCCGIRLGTGINNRGWSFVNNVDQTIVLHDSIDCNRAAWWRHMTTGQQANAAGSDWGGRVSSVQLYTALGLRC